MTKNTLNSYSIQRVERPDAYCDPDLYWLSLGNKLTSYPGWREPLGVENVEGMTEEESPYIYYDKGRKRAPNLRSPVMFGWVIMLLQERTSGACVVQLGQDWWSISTDEGEWDYTSLLTPAESLVCALLHTPTEQEPALRTFMPRSAEVKK